MKVGLKILLKLWVHQILNLSLESCKTSILFSNSDFSLISCFRKGVYEAKFEKDCGQGGW